MISPHFLLDFPLEFSRDQTFSCWGQSDDSCVLYDVLIVRLCYVCAVQSSSIQCIVLL